MYGPSPWNPSPGEWVCPSCSSFNDYESETCWSCGLRMTFSDPPDFENKPPAPSVRRSEHQARCKPLRAQDQRQSGRAVLAAAARNRDRSRREQVSAHRLD
jgi:hypothetical protein